MATYADVAAIAIAADTVGGATARDTG
jgi:hypothetical protein